MNEELHRQKVSLLCDGLNENGRDLLLQNKVKEAEEVFNRVLAFDAASITAHLNLVDVYPVSYTHLTLPTN
jgi:hypothetical protein